MQVEKAMFLQVIHLMPTICTCKQTSCKMIMIEHYPCSVPCQFFLFPVLRHNIWGENLHHPHMPSADVYSNKSNMWFFFHIIVCFREQPQKPRCICSLTHAHGVLSWSSTHLQLVPRERPPGMATLLCASSTSTHSYCTVQPIYTLQIEQKIQSLETSPSASFPLCLQYHLIVIGWGMAIHNLWRN